MAVVTPTPLEKIPKATKIRTTGSDPGSAKVSIHPQAVVGSKHHAIGNGSSSVREGYFRLISNGPCECDGFSADIDGKRGRSGTGRCSGDVIGDCS